MFAHVARWRSHDPGGPNGRAGIDPADLEIDALRVALGHARIGFNLDTGAITFSGTFSGTLVGARSGAGAGAGVWAGFGTVSGMSIGVEPG